MEKIFKKRRKATLVMKKKTSEMKIYIFKPSSNWSYCGGGFVCIAESLEQAQSLAGDHKLFLTQEDADDKPDSYYAWVLMETLYTNETEQRVVLFDYNWG
ncbi:MAG: hypothetical protein IPP74_14695 [Alphaproteobacteria bacterium]|nr:hypothetical protein [Alphaproteobacteria bacterium]